MSKKFLILISFVLVASLAGNALSADLVMPDFAGGPSASAVLWEFEDGNATSGETSDSPTIILYSPEPPDACFGFRYYGIDFDGNPDPNFRFIWNTNGTVVCPVEESVVQPLPDGEGDNLTVQFQVTWQGPNGLALSLELWGGYPPNAPRQGEWLDGIGNEGGTIDLPPIAEVNIVGGWKHTTYRHTFKSLDIAVTHTHIIFFGYEQGTAGLLIDEVVVDMVVHDGADPPAGPGRPWLRIPRAGQARDPVPANNEEHVLPDVNLSWSPDPCLLGPLDYDVWFGTDSNMANNPKIASNIGANTVDPCLGGDLDYGTVYYWRVDTNDANGREGIDWRFTTLGLADDESPADGATGAKPSVILSWVEDDYASSRDIYFDTNEAAVTNATTANTATYPGVYRGSTAPLDPCDPNRNTYDPPEILDLLTDAFWRIDEIGAAGAVEGDVWSFKSAPYFVVDDVEPYLDLAALTGIWTTGHLIDNGAQLSLETVPDYIRGGDKSIDFAYRNDKIATQYRGSEAVANTSDLQAGSDWTASGAKALTLYFYGDADNAQEGLYIPDEYHITNDQMYVALEDGSAKVGIVKYDKKYNYDMNDIKEPFWHEWNINLQDPCLAAVDMNNVAKVYIGFGGAKTGQSAGGAGTKSGKFDTVWFDDIQLHPPRCVPSVSLPYGDTTGSYSGGEDPGPTDGDCIIDYWDLFLMSGDWLVSDYEVDPAPPNDANLILEYLFDSDFSDTSSNGRTGVPGGDFPPTVTTPGFMTNADGYLDVPFGADNPFHGSEDFSIFITYRSDTQDALMPLITSCDPCLPTDWDDPNVDAESEFIKHAPLAVTVLQETSGPSGPDDITCIFDYWMRDGTNVEKTVQGGIGSWHYVAATYDADGGTCPDDQTDPNVCTAGQPSGLITVYLDGTPTPDLTNIDPNIPQDPNYDVVRIGASVGLIHTEDMGFATFAGDINDVRIYDTTLTHAEVLYLSGIAVSTYFPNESPANLMPKVPPGAPFDANNLDIVNFRDYGVMSSNWLDEILWP